MPIRDRLITGFCRVSISSANDIDIDSNADDYKRGDTWQTGDRVLVGATVTLSRNNRASSCRVVLNDRDNAIAGKYILTSFQEKGIQGLPPKPSKAAPTASSGGNLIGTLPSVTSGAASDAPAAIIAECKRQGVTAPHKIAFILAVAEGESHFNHNAYNDEGGAFGQYGGRGLGQITHDYNYKKWGERLKVDLLGKPELAFRPDISTAILVGGIREGWTGAGGLDKWMPSPTSDRQAAYSNIQGGVWRPDYDKYYQKWLKQIGAIESASSTSSPSETPASKESKALPEEEEVAAKGRVIEIQLGFEASRAIVTAEFIHNGTDTNNRGETVFTGQSIRAVMNRVKRNSAFKEITLAQLAERVAKAYGLQAKTDPGMAKIKLEYVDQSGISDYQLLIRECNFHGYQISDRGSTLVFSRPSAIESGYILYYLGGDLDTWQVSDKAASQLSELKDASIKFTPSAEGTVKDEAKNKIDPMTGKVATLQKESDRPKEKTKTEATKLPGTTGAATPPPVSDPSSAGVGLRWVEKRVKGLPANFSVPTTPALLKFTPTTAFNTDGHPHRAFNRMWMVDEITHNYDLGRMNTQISAFTPMDVRYQESESARSSSDQASTNNQNVPPAPDSEWQHPIVGATSCGPKCEFGYARGRLHAGLDWGGYGDDTVRAMRNGVVRLARTSLDDGYGMMVEIVHPDGWWSRYAHLASISVRNGQKVNKGQPIGVRGGSGAGSMNAYPIHLHGEIRRPDGTPVDPRTILPKAGAPVIVGG